MKRFYENVDVAEVADAGWQVTLDGRGLRTVKGTPQIVPTRKLAQALAREWAEQSENIDTSRFVHRDQTDFAINIVANDPEEAISQIIKYAETDTLCYRADPEHSLFERQQAVWEPLIERVEQSHGVKFTRVSGIVPRPQPPETLAKLSEFLSGRDHFTLAGMQTMASLAASLCIPLLALENGADPIGLWHAASLEEEWQSDLWGRDQEAETRRRRRQEAFLAACKWVNLLND
ncbi:MAG: molecular chaperone [Altererythrobacter sp.]|nr:molecular chaperone [Altererythrobacter sp.]NNE48994.1 molecular chaperone [Altererythrobacter sp.]NNF93402.1 molecular chaperone [Altererythrobacter sp.]NNK46258.1 molecular chaperone [Altererythrobacter sp.]